MIMSGAFGLLNSKVIIKVIIITLQNTCWLTMDKEEPAQELSSYTGLPTQDTKTIIIILTIVNDGY